MANTAGTAMTFQQIWSAMPDDKRRRAADAFWGDSELRSAQATAADEISRRLKIRAVTMKRLPVETKAKYLAAIHALSEPLAAALLRSYFFAQDRPLMAAFLDAAGVPHKDCVLEDNLSAPAPDQLRQARQQVRAQYPAEDVELYFKVLLAQDPQMWAPLAE